MKCLFCDEIFSSKQGLLDHLKTINDKQLYNLKCSHCNVVFKYSCQLQKHLLKINIQKEIERRGWRKEYYTCKICSKTYDNYDSFLRHENFYHLEKVPCKVCNKLYRHREIKRHERTHAPRALLYACKVCNKSYCSKGALRAHEHYVCEGPFRCKICSKVLDNRNALKRHQFQHSPIRPVTCQICNKKFAEKSVLEAHKRVHSEDRPFLCGQCGKQFKYSSSLHMHKLRHQEKSCVCEKCGKGFVTKEDLERHINTVHLTVKIITCVMCNSKFKCLQNLRKHFRRFKH